MPWVVGIVSPEWLLLVMGALLSAWGGSLLWRAEDASRPVRVRALAIVPIAAGLALVVAGFNLWRVWGRWGRLESDFAWVTPWHTAGFVLAAALLGLAARGLYGDPARGRARCPRCWYDMSGGGHACPECGRRIASPAALLRRRRWWRLVSIAALGLVVVVPGLMGVPRVQREGWRGLVPTTVMIAGLPWLPDTLVADDGRMRGTLRDRMGQHDMWSWQHRWVRARATTLMLRDPRSDAFRRGHAIVHCRDLDLARFAPVFLGWLISDEADLRRAAARIDRCWDRLAVSPEFSPSAPEVDPFIPALLPRLEDEDMGVRRMVAFLLMGRPDHAEIIVPALIRAAEHRDEGGVVAVRSLAWYAHVSPEAVRWVVNALESDAPFMKDEVAGAIVTLPPRSPPARALIVSPEFQRAVEAFQRSADAKARDVRMWLDVARRS